MSDLQYLAAAPKIHYYASISRELGKLASTVSGDQSVSVLTKKAAADASLFSLLEKTANRLIENLKTLKNPALAGFGYAAGAAVPIGLLGSYLINDAKEGYEDVLYPVLGAAGVGAGLYGLSRLFGNSEGRSAAGKQGSAAFLVAYDLVKVASETEDPEMKKLADETLQIALAHVADVVGDLIL